MRMTEQELLHALTNDAEFKRLIMISRVSLRETVSAFPAHAETIGSKFISLTFSQDFVLGRLIESNSVWDDVKVGKEYAKFFLLNEVFNLSDAAFEQQIKKNKLFLMEMMTAFPDYAKTIRSKFIALALSSDTEFNKFIRNNNELCQAARLLFPADVEALIHKVFNSDAEFKRLISDPMCMEKTLSAFPAHAETIGSKFIALALSSDAEFKRLITNSAGLRARLNRLSPPHGETLIQGVLNDPSIFDRVVKNDEELVAFRRFCIDAFALQPPVSEDKGIKRRNIIFALEKPTLIEARAAIKAEMLERNREAAKAKVQALNRGGFFKGSEPRNVEPNPNEPRTTQLPGGGFSREIEGFLAAPHGHLQ